MVTSMVESENSFDSKKGLQTGTTTIALTCTDGVIVAADKRASMGYFIASKDVSKVHQIDDRLLMTIAGSVGDAQTLVRLMQAELRLYKLKHGKNAAPRAAATLLSNVLYQYKFFPYMVQLLVCGMEEKGEIYSLDPLGGMTEEKFASTGSGSPMAYGLLEEAYVREGTIKDNLRVAARSIKVAMARDCATGEGVDVYTITKSGVRRYDKDEIAKLLEDKEKKE